MSVKAERHCSCGGTMRARSNSQKVVDDLVAIFEQKHTGDGHEPVSAREAARVRRVEDEKARLEVPGRD